MFAVGPYLTKTSVNYSANIGVHCTQQTVHTVVSSDAYLDLYHFAMRIRTPIVFAAWIRLHVPEMMQAAGSLDQSKYQSKK